MTKPPSAGVLQLASLRNPATAFLRLHQELGDMYRIGPFYMVNSPSMAQHILQMNSEKYGKGGPIWDGLGRLLGNGLPISNGEFWQRQRKMMQPQFTKRTLENVIPLMQKAIDDELDFLMPALGSTVKMDEVVLNIAIQVVARSLFGNDISRSASTQVGEALNAMVKTVMLAAASAAVPVLPDFTRSTFSRHVGILNTIIQGFIDKRRTESEPRDDILGLLLRELDDDNERMSDTQLIDECRSLFAAGAETTAVALSWCLHHIFADPHIQSRFYEECDAVSSEEGMKLVMALPYCRNIFQESLRLYPPAWWVARACLEPDVVEGFEIPSGAATVVLPYVIQRRADIWPNPTVFDPDRFLCKVDKFAWFPFGAGPRLCIGKEFALIEGVLVLLALSRRFVFEAVQPAPFLKFHTTVRPTHTNFRIKARESLRLVG